jgi:hypothetical protein
VSSGVLSHIQRGRFFKVGNNSVPQVFIIPDLIKLRSCPYFFEIPQMVKTHSTVAKLAVAVTLILTNPYLFLAKVLIKRPFNRILPDKSHIALCYRGFTGRRLDWNNIKTFNEKIQWLKLYDHQDWHWKLCDKVGVREYVSERVGAHYLVPLLAIYDSVDEINFDQLPNQFVLKCSHDSGSAILCEDKSKLNRSEVLAYLRRKMSRNYYYVHREYQYKGIRPRIVCEKYISLGEDLEPIDYKFLCFNEEPKFIQVDVGRYTDHKRMVMNTDWTRAPFDLDPKYSDPNRQVSAPKNLEEMLGIARKLCTGFKFVRVDLYSEGDRIYFGELTLLQGSGLDPIEPYEFDHMLGNWIDIGDLGPNQDLSTVKPLQPPEVYGQAIAKSD